VRALGLLQRAQVQHQLVTVDVEVGHGDRF
jgi:hypothetical protein